MTFRNKCYKSKNRTVDQHKYNFMKTDFIPGYSIIKFNQNRKDRESSDAIFHLYDIVK